MGADTSSGSCMSHHVTSKNRESMEVSGVTDVISFDERSVILTTTCGNMAIDGDSLHVHVLSMEQGVVTMSGRIDSVTYFEQEVSENNGKHGFFGKLFR